MCLVKSSNRGGGYTSNNAYDSYGNPTTFRGSTNGYNSNNQNTAFTHDLNGNLTTYKANTLTWDAENRMTSFGRCPDSRVSRRRFASLKTDLRRQNLLPLRRGQASSGGG